MKDAKAMTFLFECKYIGSSATFLGDVVGACDTVYKSCCKIYDGLSCYVWCFNEKC